MIEKVISELNTRLETLGIFQKMFGVCDIIQKDGKSFPAQYCLGKHEPVTEFSKFKGVLYHRITGDINISHEESDTDGCAVNSTRTYPLKLVAAVKKDVYKKAKNDAYLETKLIENIEKVISFSNDKLISRLIKADYVTVELSGGSVDRYAIFNREYKGFEMFVDFEYAYISIDYSIIISQNTECIELQEC